jgi:glycosyltransferase involved in cell wall biosynthesis
MVRNLAASSQLVRVIDQVDDVRPYLAASDVLVLPTKREGMPNVVLEGAAMALPAITTTSTGAIDSVVPGKTGLLFDYGDAAGLADAIQHLAANPDVASAMGLAARQRVLRDFRPPDVARAIVDIALGAGPRRRVARSPAAPAGD